MPPPYYSAVGFFFQETVITLLELGRNMANQYSITVSDRSDHVLRQLKESGYKTSQCISAAIELLGHEALVRLVTYQRRIDKLQEEDE
ncbi:MAG: hypothetical protein [Circular genetic element sp.]|nr:MAG: hypothetical protein [Circular genetic element sp.]